MYYGKNTDKWYDSIEAMQHYEHLEAQRRMVPDPAEDAFSKLPAEEQRAVVERMVMGDQHKVALAEQNLDISTFLELY